MLSVLAELQSELIVANTRDSLAAARARGRTGGRRPKLSPARAAHAQQLYDSGDHTVAQIAALLGGSLRDAEAALLAPLDDDEQRVLRGLLARLACLGDQRSR